jgi:hypothetical protein
MRTVSSNLNHGCPASLEKEKPELKMPTLPKINSKHFAYLLAIRYPRDYGTKLFIEHFLNNSDRNSEIVEFRLQWALAQIIHEAMIFSREIARKARIIYRI